MAATSGFTPQDETDNVLPADHGSDNDDDVDDEVLPIEDNPNQTLKEAPDPEADAKLAAALQAIEDQQTAQQLVIMQQQPQVMVIPQQPMMVRAAPGPNASAEQKYLASIKDRSHNKCSCRIQTSAYMAILSWLIYDLIHCGFQVFVWLILDKHHDGALIFGPLFAIIALSNIVTMYGVPNMKKCLIIMKAPFFIFSCIMVWAEVGLAAEANKNGDFGGGLLVCLILFMIAQLVITYCALKDLRTIYKWIKYYQGNGPFTYMLP